MKYCIVLGIYRSYIYDSSLITYKLKKCIVTFETKKEVQQLARDHNKSKETSSQLEPVGNPTYVRI